MASGQPRLTTLSPAEIAQAIRGLSDADWIRLRKIAKAFARNCPLEAEDLLQEAYARALAGRRRCPRHVDVVRFLTETMHSIASGSAKRRRRQDAKFPAYGSGWTTDVVDDLPWSENAPTLDDVMAGEDEVAGIRAAILDLFADDPIAQTIVRGDMADVEAEEIRSMTGLDKLRYASKRRFIRRKIDQAFPKGWKP